MGGFFFDFDAPRRLDEYAALGEEPPEEEEVVSRDISPAERELELDEYHHMLGTFGDYRDLVLIYGYTVLFVAALPLAPLLALINAYAQIRVDAWNISVVSRRPWPQNAEDIGSWADIIELLSYIAVFTNSIIITYTGEFLTHWTNASRIITFAFLYHGNVPASRDLGTMFSAQTRTRPPRDTLDRIETETPRSDRERPRIEARLDLCSPRRYGSS